tara:strand:+ start:158 stop:280 length:123 start_codon:yes stop_codon:yes gene_type:complete
MKKKKNHFTNLFLSSMKTDKLKNPEVKKIVKKIKPTKEST